LILGVYLSRHRNMMVAESFLRSFIASGKALPHVIYPESMWISYFIRSEDVSIVDLFRLQYERLKYKPQ
jgi:transposase-like protein